MPWIDLEGGFETFRTHSSLYSVNFVTGDSSSSSSDVVGPRGPSWKLYKEWNRTPNFKVLARQGKLPDNGFFMEKWRMLNYETHKATKVVRSPESYSVSRRIVTPRLPTMSYGQPYGGAWPGVPAGLENQAVSALLSKAKGNQWNAPVFVMEGRKTVQMVCSRATQMVFAIRALRRGRFDIFLDNLHKVDRRDPKHRKARRAFNSDFGRDPLRAASDMWLEYTYGWTPFMSDVRNAAFALMDAVENEPNRIARFTGSAKSEQHVFNPSVKWEVSPESTGPYFADVKDSVRFVWRAAPNDLDLPARFGLGNPLEIGWELLPFSFVADWFLPIGDYLSALDVPYRFAHQGGTRGLFRQIRQRGFTNQSDWWTAVQGSFASEYLRVRRFPLSGPPSIDLLDFELDPAIGAKRAITSIALLRQQASRLGA